MNGWMPPSDETERAAPSEAEALVERRNWPDLSWVATRIGDQLAEQHLEAVQRDLDRLAHEGDTLRAEVERLQEQVREARDVVGEMMNEHTPLGVHDNGEIEYCQLPACGAAQQFLNDTQPEFVER